MSCSFPLHCRRPVEPHNHKLTGDLLWSDPVEEEGFSKSSRGIGIFFGPDITKRFLGKGSRMLIIIKSNISLINIELLFLDLNDLMCLIRSHTEIEAGCGQSHPKCYTVFSAPNELKNIKGGILTIEGKNQ